VVTDALHGAGAGYLDKALADHGIAVTARRTERDCLFGGGGRTWMRKSGAAGKAVKDTGAKVGLATDEMRTGLGLWMAMERGFSRI